MIAGQTLVAQDGNEVALFPLPYLYMTQDEDGDYSHAGTYNIDFVGWNGSSQVYQAPVYAPVSMKVISTSLSYYGGNAVIFESLNPVHLPNGVLDYMTIMFMHDSNPPYTTVGQTVAQGQVCYHTGTYGQVTGDHVHTCVGQGQGGYFVQRPSGNWDLSNRIHYWDGVFVNDTTIVQGYGHNWQTWDEPVEPVKRWGEREKSDYPFIIAKRYWNQF